MIHFTRKAYKADWEPFTIKAQVVRPRSSVKVLGVVMDTRLKYKEHIARAASKGLEAVMELKRLRGLSPLTARQLFTSTVAPVVDYASNVCMHEVRFRAVWAMNRVQRIGAQAIVGTFSTVAASVAEAEAHIATAHDRFWRRAIKLWTDMHTLPETNPLRSAAARMLRKFKRFYPSPFFQVADAQKAVPMDSLETINPFTLVLWEKRTQAITGDAATELTHGDAAIRIAVSSSAQNEVVGMGGAIEIRASSQSDISIETFSSTIGARTVQNPYSGELTAMATASSRLPRLRYRNIVLLTRTKSAALTVRQPRQQSGQGQICRVYQFVRALRREGNTLKVIWLPSSEENELLKLAKGRAKAATRQGATPQTQLPNMRSTTLRVARAKRDTAKTLPEKVGKYSKRIDTALPGKHTRQLYDRLTRQEAAVLAQLRTGMARLNGYLYRINAAESDQCACGQARETVEHFLFRCTRWTVYRSEMLQCTDIHRSNMTFYLGGRSPSDDKNWTSDDKNWTPNMEAVRAAIHFAIATGRLDTSQPQEDTS
jgi:hypothetical protein